jgi:hypothetical protein
MSLESDAMMRLKQHHREMTELLEREDFAGNEIAAFDELLTKSLYVLSPRRGPFLHVPGPPSIVESFPMKRPSHGPHAEDQKLARSVLRRLRPDTTSVMSDAELDADPICGWVSCLFRRVRDEIADRAQSQGR